MHNRLQTPISKITLIFILLIALAAMGRDQTSSRRPFAAQAAAGGNAYLPLVLTAPRNVGTVNAPFFLTGSPEFPDGVFSSNAIMQSAVFWFGKVTPTTNYTDVRVGYDDDELRIYVATFDRRLWYDTSPDLSALQEWDAISLYLDLNGHADGPPDAQTHLLVSQLRFSNTNGNWQNYQTSYQGNGSGWAPSSLAYTSWSDHKAGSSGPNDNDGNDSGWMMDFRIPFDSLGLSGPPADGEIWALGVRLHDRDDSAGTPIPAQTWPTDMDPDQPSSWGRLRFGIPDSPAAPNSAQQTITVRHGLNGNVVVDGTVGGHSVCGSLAGSPMYSTWGEMNYAGFYQFNVQNQRDLSDWPCFAKYFVTFPLDDIPPGATIVSADFQLIQFGQAGEPPFGPMVDSYIQVLTVFDSWQEATLTWNNAPLAAENIAGTWAQPVSSFTPRHWDITRAVAEAHAAGHPLRLAVYSADTDYNSGKYFWGSDAWNEEPRPTLTVEVAVP